MSSLHVGALLLRLLWIFGQNTPRVSRCFPNWPAKKTSYFPLYWLLNRANRDPHNALWNNSQYNCVGFHPLKKKKIKQLVTTRVPFLQDAVQLFHRSSFLTGRYPRFAWTLDAWNPSDPKKIWASQKWWRFYMVNISFPKDFWIRKKSSPNLQGFNTLTLNIHLPQGFAAWKCSKEIFEVATTDYTPWN